MPALAFPKAPTSPRSRKRWPKVCGLSWGGGGVIIQELANYVSQNVGTYNFGLKTASRLAWNLSQAVQISFTKRNLYWAKNLMFMKIPTVAWL